MSTSLKHDYAAAPDEELVRWSQQGEAEAFEELVHRHRDKTYARALMMLRNEDEANDVSQEAWVKAWQRINQFQGESSFATWMTRIVINLCLDQLRKQKRARVDSIEEMEEESGGVERQLPVTVTNPTEGLEKDELRRRIDEAMGKLTDAHRAVLVMHEFEGMEYKEIAKKVGISIGTVMSRLFYARRRLATLLHGLKRERSE
ncbi:MAG TPA: sigma-70 family RNA polymerase sigma factor [Candidatus Limnocylindria bacterium]|nr:sigma-70 family RNA polymerase sigma factor [Candidatus Limnocylindria bacterium]